MWVRKGILWSGVVALLAIVVVALWSFRSTETPVATTGHDDLAALLSEKRIRSLDPVTRQLVQSALQAVEQQIDSAHAWRDLGMVLQANKFIPEAVIAYEHSVSRIDDDAQAWYHLAIAYDELGDIQQARRAIHRVVQEAPENPAGHWRSGLFELELGNVDHAERGFARAIELDPHNEPAHIGLARVRLQQDRVEDAAALLEPIARRHGPNASYANQLLASAWRRMGLIEPGMHAASRGIAGHTQLESPWDIALAGYCSLPAVQMDVARAVSRQGHLQQAVDMLTQLAQHRPNDPATFTHLAICYREHGQFAQSVSNLKHALQLRPDSYFANAQLAVTYLEQARAETSKSDELLQLALRSIDAALEINPSMPAAHGMRGDVLRERGRQHEAAKAYVHAAQLDAGGTSWLWKAGRQLLRLQQWTQAEEIFTRLTGLSPNDADAHLLLGHTRVRLDDIPGARVAFAHGQELAPNDQRFAQALQQLSTRQVAGEESYAP